MMKYFFRWSQLVSKMGSTIPEGVLQSDSLAKMDGRMMAELARADVKAGKENGATDGGGSCCGEGEGGCGRTEAKVAKADLEEELCHACRLVCRRLPDADGLPEDVRLDVAVARRRKAAEEQIKDFLL